MRGLPYVNLSGDDGIVDLMIKHKRKMLKKAFCLAFAFLLSINSFAAIVSDNDGSAFITKDEFDALKKDFANQIDNYNSSIEQKIDGAIASYLAGFALEKQEQRKIKYSTLDTISSLDLDSSALDWKDYAPSGTLDVDVIGFRSGRNPTAFNQDFDSDTTNIIPSNIYDYWIALAFPLNGWSGKGCIISSLDKTNSKATWEGYSENISASIVCTNTYINDNLTLQPKAGEYEPFVWDTRTKWMQINNSEIEHKLALTTVTRTSGLSTTREHYLRSYNETYNSIKFLNAIIWNGKEYSNFITEDETLGFGNTNAYRDDTKPIMILCDTYDYRARFSVRYVDTDPTSSSYNLERRYVGNRNKSYRLDTANTSQYSSTDVFPGKRFASDYITNFNQLFQKNVVESSTGESLYLFQGFPLCEANSSEKIEWSVEFTDSGNYEFVASFRPFDDEMDDDSNWIKLSNDNVNYAKRATIENGKGKLYFDFVNNGYATKGSTIYIKWHKIDSSSVYNGGGTINLKHSNVVIVTKE